MAYNRLYERPAGTQWEPDALGTVQTVGPVAEIYLMFGEL